MTYGNFNAIRGCPPFVYPSYRNLGYSGIMLDNYPSSDTIHDMDIEFMNQSNCELLAEQLGNDILQRGLKSGDRYITTVKAAEQLGVSRMSADRAMNVLVEKRLLIRQRGRGTFVGPGARTSAISNAIHVHLIIFGEGESTMVFPPPAATLAGLRSVMPTSILHTHILPFADGCLHARQLVESEPSTNLSAWILAASSREVQQWFAQQDIPTIVLGGVFPEISLPNMEPDQTEAMNKGGQATLFDFSMACLVDARLIPSPVVRPCQLATTASRMVGRD